MMNSLSRPTKQVTSFLISGDFNNSGDLSGEVLVFCYFIKN